MKKIEKLKQERSRIDIEIRDIEEKELEEKLLPTLKKNIGKCFVYVNSYGGSTDKWNYYHRVIGVTDNANYLVDSFQHTSDGTIEIKNSDVKHTYSGRDVFSDSCYREITIDEYQQAQRDLLKIVKKVLT